MSDMPFTLPQATSKFLEACAHNNINQMMLYMKCDDVAEYAYHLGLAMSLQSENHECFEVLSKYLLQKEEGLDRSKHDFSSPGMNSIVSASVHKNARSQLDKIFESPPVEHQCLDNALFWCLEEFAENDDIPSVITQKNLSQKAQGVCYLIEKSLVFKKLYPQTVKQIKLFAQSPFYHPLLDHVAQHSSVENQKELSDMFKLKNCPPFIKSIKEKEILEKSLKKGSFFKKYLPSIKNNDHVNKTTPSKKM